MISKRPWGSFRVLEDGPGFKVKILVIKPGQRTSLQKHSKRTEHITCVSGKGKATFTHSRSIFTSGVYFQIDQDMVHRFENVGSKNLVLLELQLGDCFEEDIKRLSDDYGRK